MNQLILQPQKEYEIKPYIRQYTEEQKLIVNNITKLNLEKSKLIKDLSVNDIDNSKRSEIQKHINAIIKEVTNLGKQIKKQHYICSHITDQHLDKTHLREKCVEFLKNEKGLTIPLKNMKVYFKKQAVPKYITDNQIGNIDCSTTKILYPVCVYPNITETFESISCVSNIIVIILVTVLVYKLLA